ncbi:alpha-L-fucosidase [Streptomyces dysideae]|uniref:alpha-L-fucosidase n=1 Tax=Streptomyces dysideae TaxID=909626 RepID=A0A101UQ39_9ACTN|nr:alpha-L-fucosidase [Streptomyces dysideae]KUO14814.1 glycosyl hydrolase [Streptomyces dysideae]
MSSVPLSRRSLIKAAALAGGTVAFGLPQALWPATAEAYTVASKMDWWYQARFGMFIHFGSYSYLGRGEWAFSVENWTKANYQAQVTTPFNPSAFNANTIAQLAQDAGMKYLVFTAKHHEGYAMWDSDVPGFTDVTGTKLYNLRDYNNFQPDLLLQLKTACESRGIKFGLYYSILDWTHSSQTCDSGRGFSDMSSLSARTGYINDMKAQLQELLNRYDPAILWFDGDWCADPSSPTLEDWWVKADGEDLYSWLMARKPGLIVNERVKRDVGLGDYAVAEFGIPDAPMDRPWEACATMNHAWGYHQDRENAYRSVQTIIQEMVTVVSRDGNYLLNIGPKADGTVTAGSVTVLNGMASWMATHGDSIHGTSGSPFATEPSWGRITKKDGKLFAHVFNWPTGGTLQIPAVHNTINRVYLMNNPGTNLNYWVSGGQINVQVPTTAPNANDSVVCVEVNGMPAVLAGGVYRLVCAQSGKALDNANVGSDGTPIIQWTVNGGTPQQWTVTDQGHGYYKLVCVRSGKALDDNNSTSNSAVMVQKTDNGSHQQQWAITALGGGAYRLINRHSGKALDNSNNAADNTQVIQWTPNGGPPQQWNMTKVG